MKKIFSVALVLVMLFALTVSAAALSSPTGRSFYKIDVDHTGSGTAYSDKTKIDVNSDGVVTLTAEDGDDPFDHWNIDGDYEIREGDLSSPVLRIIPLSDIHATAVFGNGSDGGKKGNDSNTSPKTGDPLVAVIGLMALALAAGVVATKKIKES